MLAAQLRLAAARASPLARAAGGTLLHSPGRCRGAQGLAAAGAARLPTLGAWQRPAAGAWLRPAAGSGREWRQYAASTVQEQQALAAAQPASASAAAAAPGGALASTQTLARVAAGCFSSAVLLAALHTIVRVEGGNKACHWRTHPAEAPATEAVVLDVRGMKCGGCSAAVKRMLLQQPGVAGAAVNLLTETAVVQVAVQESAVGQSPDELAAAAAAVLTSKGFPAQLRSVEAGVADDAAALSERKQEELKKR